jgi:branched-chain amino acid transport system permease protein
MLGMYVAYYLVTGFGVLAFLGPYAGPVVGAILAGPIVFVIGWLLHRFLISRVTGARVVSADAEGHYMQLIMTLGVALVLSNGGLILFGSLPLSRRHCRGNPGRSDRSFSIRHARLPSCWRRPSPSGCICS